MNELDILNSALQKLKKSTDLNCEYIRCKSVSNYAENQPNLVLKSPDIKKIPTPEDKLTTKLNVPILIGLILGCIISGIGIILLPLVVGGYILYYRNARNNELNTIQNDPQYFQECEQIKQYNIQSQLNADAANVEIRKNYETQLSKWKGQKQEYETKMQNRINELEAQMTEVRNNCYAELDKLNLNEKYRNIDSLQLIIDQMSTSTCSLSEACYIVDLNRAKQQLENTKQQIEYSRSQLELEKAELEEVRESAIRAAQIAEESQYNSDEEYSNQSNSSFTKSVAGAAIGTAIANRYDRKQRAKIDAAKAEAEAKYRKEQDEKERRLRDKEIREHNMMRNQIIKENQKRRRNGQPELPVPPTRYS